MKQSRWQKFTREMRRRRLKVAWLFRQLIQYDNFYANKIKDQKIGLSKSQAVLLVEQ